MTKIKQFSNEFDVHGLGEYRASQAVMHSFQDMYGGQEQVL